VDYELRFRDDDLGLGHRVHHALINVAHHACDGGAIGLRVKGLGFRV
jgi:hypothetical protein